jgi:proteasome lid subunit RPN8/RPN11
MAKPAKVKIRVSTQPVVVMEAEVLRKIRQHARTSMKAEVCGVLIGNTEQERMTVEACIAGINAAQGGAHVTFTQDTWEHIYKIKDKEFPDHKIVGWYHSHPGFGVFLSEHDLFIQQNFFSNPLQVAWVFDPHTDEEGCFGWIGGNIEKLTDIRVGYSQTIQLADTADHDEDLDDDQALDSMVRPLNHEKSSSREPAWVNRMILTVGCLASLMVGLVLGWFFLNRKVASAVDQFDQIKQLLERDERFIEGLQQHPEIFAPGAYSLIFGRPSQPVGAASQPQASPQQPAPAQTPDNKASGKGNNGKH